MPRMQLQRVDPNNRLPGEGSVWDVAAEIFDDPNGWMQQEHPMLAGRSPQQCIDDGDEQVVWDLLRTIKYVGQT